LIEKSADAILLVDADITITYANPAVGELLGHDHQTVRNMSLLTFIHPTDREILDNLPEDSSTGEIRVRRPDGFWASCQITITNLLDDLNVNGVLLTLKDISHQKETQKSLKTQRDLLQNLVVVARATSEAAELEEMLHDLVKIGKWLTKAVNGSVFLFDQVGALVYTRSYHGRLDPDRVQQLMVSGLSGWVVENNKPALIIDTQTDGRWLNLPTNGYVPRSALAIPILSGQILLAILVLTHSKPGHFNPGHLKTLEAASGQMAMAMKNARLYSDAQSNLADLNALIASTQDGIVLINPDGHTRVINEAALNLGGLPGKPADWIGQFAIYLFRQVRQSAPELIRVLIRESRRTMKGDNTGAEGEIQTATHDIHWLHMPVTVNERIIGRLLILRDITRQRKLERQREELTNMIVHDLRNPVSAISGIVAMLKSVTSLDGIPPDFDQMIQLAERNVSKMLELVQEILDVSQLENEQLPLKMVPLSITDLIKDTVKLQSSIVIVKEIKLDSSIEAELPLTFADERLIQRVLQNLVDNAAKFSARKSSIYISAKRAPVHPDYIQVSVKDQGVGMPDELKGRVFEKFVTGTHAQRGSGLGLTFCRLAVQAHGGQIWAESVEAMGSTFHFTLPAAQLETSNLLAYSTSEAV
jgi:PAS domain S-box-containing protein